MDRFTWLPMYDQFGRKYRSNEAGEMAVTSIEVALIAAALNGSGKLLCVHFTKMICIRYTLERSIHLAAGEWQAK